MFPFSGGDPHPGRAGHRERVLSLPLFAARQGAPQGPRGTLWETLVPFSAKSGGFRARLPLRGRCSLSLFACRSYPTEANSQNPWHSEGLSSPFPSLLSERRLGSAETLQLCRPSSRIPMRQLIESGNRGHSHSLERGCVPRRERERNPTHHSSRCVWRGALSLSLSPGNPPLFP